MSLSKLTTHEYKKKLGHIEEKTLWTQFEGEKGEEEEGHDPMLIFLEEEEEIEEIVSFSEMTLNELEKRHICLTLDHLAGNKTKTAKMLGITVKTLYNKLHSYGMIGNQQEA